MRIPASFEKFAGNRPVVENLRAAIATMKLPHSLIIAGARGSGKYTLALLLTMALECEQQPREISTDGRNLASFCGVCRNCTRIAESADLDTKIEEAVTTREEMREADKRDTRILVQTHPDVLIVPPDPPQLLIKLGQIRTVIQRAQYLPIESPAKVFVLTSASMMKEAANSLLKILEEPPPYAHLFLLAENLGELLPTIRSRCAVAHLGTLPSEQVEEILCASRPEMTKIERELVVRLCEGAAGRALGFDLAGYIATRADALTMLQSMERTNDHSASFRVTETYRAGAEGQVRTNALLRGMASLLEDILLLQAGAGDRILNIDKRMDLQSFADAFDFGWVERAVRGLDGVQSGMRRNLLRSLSLDAFAAELEGTKKYS